MRNSEGEIIERKMGSLRQIHNFVNVLNEGDTVIPVVMGERDWKQAERILMVPIYEVTGRHQMMKRGIRVYIRGAIREGSYQQGKLDDLKVKIQTLTKQEGGIWCWGGMILKNKKGKSVKQKQFIFVCVRFFKGLGEETLGKNLKS